MPTLLSSLALRALLLVLLVAGPLAAQGVDIIRGRVTSPTGEALQNVTVTATTLTGQVSRSVRTGRDGRYTLSFPGGEGDYWVSFSAIGLAPRRYQVKRTADQEILIADARLSPAAVNLEAVTTTTRVAAARGDTVGDVSGNERDLNASTDPGLLSAEQMGDLVAMASVIPGVQLIPGADGGADAFSVFGLSGDQNNTQLNGLNFGDASIPRDAQVFASLSTSPYDVSRGGFSGGQLTLRTRSGSNFMRRSLSTNLVGPPTQWVDSRALASGQQYTNLSLGGSASGPISPDKLFYNSSFQFDRRMNDLQTLVNTNPLGFTTAGVAPDSVLRFLDIIGGQSLPANVSGFPGQTITNRGSFLGSFDFTPPNSARGNTYALSVSGNLNQTLPTGGGGGGGGFGGGGFGGGGSALSTPTRQGKRLSYSGSAQLRQSGLLGIGGILTETTVGVNVSRTENDPYLFLPSGSVRVNSVLEDGTASVRNLTFGGSPAANTANGNGSIGFVNTLSWFSGDNRHRVKLTSEFRYEDYWQDLTQNELGTFSFNAPRRREGSQMVGAMSLGDAWRPINDVQIQYGVRVDGNRFLIGPNENPAVAQSFGLNNADVPNRLYVSPRAVSASSRTRRARSSSVARSTTRGCRVACSS
ncbi:MAG: carboxypeptidase-like regulatory domain-containing protein [Gemmatimonadaceae bacterium]|nr:carboxypeptidase-like regulatory domain-containing protein [Gemmatimonadaceae bacterium]